MASKIFQQTLKEQLGKKYKGDRSGQQLEILEKARVKSTSLAFTIKIRSKQSGESPNDGFLLSQPDIDDFFEAADKLVVDILRNMANEDIEELTNQTTKRLDKRSTTSVKGGAFLRDKKGRFISPFNLERLLNLTLYTYAQRHMGVDGQLKNRTGRLAHSGVVTGINTDSYTQSVSFFFTYMLYPYEVFENRPDGRYDGTNYSPIRLFKDAIMSALNDLLSPTSVKMINENSIKFRGGR